MNNNKTPETNEMTRRAAIKKIGYAAATTSMMMILLNSQSARATSVNTGPSAPTTNTNGGGTSPVNWND